MVWEIQLLTMQKLSSWIYYLSEGDDSDSRLEQCLTTITSLCESMWWTLDAFLCSVESKTNQCNTPFNIEVIPVKESVHKDAYQTWIAYSSKKDMSSTNRRLQCLMWACQFVMYMQALCEINNIGPFIHGSLIKENCMFSINGVKVANYSRTYVKTCHPLLSKKTSWSEKYLQSSWFMDEKYNEACADFTFYYTYVLGQSGDPYVNQNKDTKYTKGHFSTLVKWFDVLTFVNSIRDDKAFLDIIKEFDGFKDPVIKSMMTYSESSVKNFVRDRFPSYNNNALTNLHKYEVKDFVNWLTRKISE